MNQYVLAYEYQYGLDCYLFQFQPTDNKPYPSELALARHFDLDFDPAKGERLAVVAVNNCDAIPHFTAEQIGTSNPCDSSLDELEAAPSPFIRPTPSKAPQTTN